MASKSKEPFLADILQPTKAGGKVELRSSSSGSRKSSTGWNSGGESSSSSDGELYPQRVAEKIILCQTDGMEFSPALGRPDTETTILQIDGTSLEDFVVRVSETNTHVLMMGSPSMISYPLRCPFKEARCLSFRARAPQFMKEHLESKHKLNNVQVNLACPCPAVCNVVNGEARECHAVKYDPMNGVLESHIQRRHWKYFDTMGYSLCIRHEKEENLLDVSEEVKNYVQYLDLKPRKKLPAWTREDHARLFPSQVIPEKVILQAVLEGGSILYQCNIPPCHGERAMTGHAMSLHLGEEPGHLQRVGSGSRFVQRCPKSDCGLIAHWSAKNMLLHVRAMHPEMLGEPSSFTEAANTELAKLLGQIEGKIIGRAIGDTAKRGSASDGTKPHCLYSFRCHLQNCKQSFSQREHLEWHITADHQREWNKGH